MRRTWSHGVEGARRVSLRCQQSLTLQEVGQREQTTTRAGLLQKLAAVDEPLITATMLIHAISGCNCLLPGSHCRVQVNTPLISVRRLIDINELVHGEDGLTEIGQSEVLAVVFNLARIACGALVK